MFVNMRFLPFIAAGFFILAGCKKDNFPRNKVPVANAGASQVIVVPADLATDSVTLSGNGHDLDGKIVAYLWSQVSGPDFTTIINPGSPSTRVKGFKTGTYIFQLMVTDDEGATGVDTTAITVKPGNVSHTLTLQPSNNPAEFQITLYDGQDLSYNGNPEISIDAWTSGALWTLRDIFKFDLSGIPANATIISASLYLYSNPTPGTGNLVDANFGTNNSLFLHQITSNWDSATVGWFNQPAVSLQNQLSIPSTTLSFFDLNLDVTNMVSPMVNGNANYGFLLRLQSEVIYNSRIFVSSFNTTYPDKHPKLVVVYK